MVIEIGGFKVTSQNKPKLRQNARTILANKICSSPVLTDYMQKGNYFSIDVRSGFQYGEKQIGNYRFTNQSCV
ncbi:hypothetical protein D5018_21515 [Parashewanella curva]|uniref:Uncharacterized protein n=2 Tax=Parashewanella curva TaxID=2338552 RepID=A0A3L8PQJ6_9GAMM|nr:hypothetical protein D5018_21515 [Parashewanella curva]